MSVSISETTAAGALRGGVDPLDHLGVMDWCQHNIRGFSLLQLAERQCLASQLQVKGALLQQRMSDCDVGEDTEGGVALEDGTGGSVLGKKDRKTTTVEVMVPSPQKKKERPPIVNHVTESIEDITSRVLQADVDLDRPNHSLMVWAWCVFNVAGFADSHQRIRKEISQAVDERLFGATEGNTEEDPPSNNEPESPKFSSRQKEKKSKKWYNQIKDPAEKIVDRFPYREIDYCNTIRVNAWCILHVDGFVESGVVPQHQTSKRLHQVLEARYGGYEGGGWV